MTASAFHRSIAEIDAANAADPNVTETASGPRPHELVYSERLTSWVERLAPGAAEPLLLAARAQHIRRWEHPRSAYPEGRQGYLRWRTALYRFHADTAAELLAASGVDRATVERVRDLVAKRVPRTDADAQALEDGLCLVFLEDQFAGLAAKVEREKMITILRKTWRKMSPAAQTIALGLRLPEAEQELVRAALNTDSTPVADD
jgi:Domain of unknown function (DUF4202)